MAFVITLNDLGNNGDSRGNSGLVGSSMCKIQRIASTLRTPGYDVEAETKRLEEGLEATLNDTGTDETT